MVVRRMVVSCLQHQQPVIKLAFGRSQSHLMNVHNQYFSNGAHVANFSTQASSFFGDPPTSSPPCSDPQIEVPIRFTGEWQKVRLGKFSFMRYDLVVGCRKTDQVDTALTTRHQLSHYENLTPRGAAEKKSFLIELAVEKRGFANKMSVNSKFNNSRAPSGQTRYTGPVGIGDKIDGMSLLIDEENIEKILQFDGEKKELIKIEDARGNDLPTIGLIGMENK